MTLKRNPRTAILSSSEFLLVLNAAHAKTGITVHFEWTLGKKSPVLKRVDKVAKAAATRGGPDIDRG